MNNKARLGQIRRNHQFVKLMIERKGVGDIFADGTKKAAERRAKALKNMRTPGGQECGMHDSRGDPPLAIHYSVDATPGRHTTGSSQYYSVAHIWKKVSWAPALNIMPKSREYEPSREEAVKSVAMGLYKRIIDAAGACFFGMLLGVENFKLFEWLNLATGWNKTPDEYMFIAKRIFTLRQLFNIKHGVNPLDFRLHKRLSGEPPLMQGPLKGKTVRIDEMMREFWDYLNYDKTGKPTAECVRELGLEELVNEESVY